MPAQMCSNYPPGLTVQQSEYLLSLIKDWSIAHGFAVRPPPSLISPESDPGSVLAVPAPVTVFPSVFPRACFHEAWEIQKAYNELYAAIVRDEDWLAKIIEEYVLAFFRCPVCIQCQMCDIAVEYLVPLSCNCLLKGLSRALCLSSNLLQDS